DSIQWQRLESKARTKYGLAVPAHGARWFSIPANSYPRFSLFCSQENRLRSASLFEYKERSPDTYSRSAALRARLVLIPFSVLAFRAHFILVAGYNDFFASSGTPHPIIIVRVLIAAMVFRLRQECSP